MAKIASVTRGRGPGGGGRAKAPVTGIGPVRSYLAVLAAILGAREMDNLGERSLRDEVVPVAMAMLADPSRAIPVDLVFDEIRALHVERVAAKLLDA